MRVIDTSAIGPEGLSSWERSLVYNGLDCCVTHEVLDQLLPELDPTTQATYDFSRALQGPVLDMNIRGLLVDEARREEVIDEYYDLIDRFERQLDRIVLDGCGMESFNWRSTADLRRLFYEVLRIPAVRAKGSPTVNRAALERLHHYLIARPIVNHILTLRDLGKKIGMLKTAIDPDRRMRTSYNIAGTATGRFSSSYSEYGTGTNLQNIEESLRSIFVPDPGQKFAKFDAKSGESYCVGAIEWNLFQDGRYLDACETGDPHVATAKLCWPRLPWSGDPKKDKDLAEQPHYRHHSYRFMCKKLGHGSNYLGTPPTLAAQAQIPEEVVAAFQGVYFPAYPAHRQWHHWVQQKLLRDGWMVSLTGRKRWFFGRRNSEDTLREAVAFDPQGSLADIVNRAMLRVWRAGAAQVVMQDHDALTFQYPEEEEDEVIPKLLALLPEPIPLSHNRELLIPYDCKTGWNRGDYDATTNPSGLKDYQGHDQRRRPKVIPIVDRVFHRAYG